MEIRTLITTIGVFLSCSGFIFAADNAKQLPNDGWWIRYRTITKQDVAGQIRESRSKLTFSLVGTVLDDGVKYRWVEKKSVFSSDGMEQTVICKFLIPEKELVESELLVKTIKRGWIKVHDSDPQPFDIKDESHAQHPQMLIFSGAWHIAETVDKEKSLDYQQGRLTIPKAKTYTTTDKSPAPRNANRKVVVEYTGWFDKATAPVLTAADIQTRNYRGDVLRWATELGLFADDFGVGAKSELPDNN